MATKGAVALKQKQAVDRINDAADRIANRIGLTRQALIRRNRRNPRTAGLDEAERLEIIADFIEDVAETIAPGTKAVPADEELDALTFHEDGTIDYGKMSVAQLHSRIDRLGIDRAAYGLTRDARQQEMVDMLYAFDANISGANFMDGQRGAPDAERVPMPAEAVADAGAPMPDESQVETGQAAESKSGSKSRK